MSVHAFLKQKQQQQLHCFNARFHSAFPSFVCPRYFKVLPPHALAPSVSPKKPRRVCAFARGRAGSKALLDTLQYLYRTSDLLRSVSFVSMSFLRLFQRQFRPFSVNLETAANNHGQETKHDCQKLYTIP
jgi:hypothetical protein